MLNENLILGVLILEGYSFKYTNIVTVIDAKISIGETSSNPAGVCNVHFHINSIEKIKSLFLRAPVMG